MVVDAGKIDGSAEGGYTCAVTSRRQNGQRTARQTPVSFAKAVEHATEEMANDHITQVGQRGENP